MSRVRPSNSSDIYTGGEANGVVVLDTNYCNNGIMGSTRRLRRK